MSVFWGGAAAPPMKPLIKDVLAVTMAVFWGGSGGAAAPPGFQGRRDHPDLAYGQPSSSQHTVVILLSPRRSEPGQNHPHLADGPPSSSQHTVVILLSPRGSEPGQDHPHLA